ncbi:hypothetical protein PNOK_0867400 [Pyrrhoderma noxium]|uniref:Ricin B lectin domain-containing protein n=1 Tax=Pyrrhoderma noxium TaxID=2282107 RepID=A0A286U8C8_9AGAM|nr:hypothetical protein PNOK_0867400 [Pyrrhoderma noxium]
MKYTVFLLFALISAVYAANLIPINYYPPDEEYAIFNVEYRNRVLDNQGDLSSGHVIGSSIHYNESTSPNLKWRIEGVTFDELRGRNVSIQSFAAAHSDTEVGGFVSTNGSDIIESQDPVSWELRLNAFTGEQFLIIKDDLAITALSAPDPKQEWPLAAQEINTTDTRQYWIFVPVGGVQDYLFINNITSDDGV